MSDISDKEFSFLGPITRKRRFVFTNKEGADDFNNYSVELKNIYARLMDIHMEEMERKIQEEFVASYVSDASQILLKVDENLQKKKTNEK